VRRRAYVGVIVRTRSTPSAAQFLGRTKSKQSPECDQRAIGGATRQAPQARSIAEARLDWLAARCSRTTLCCTRQRSAAAACALT
jgi:hypothetical protein